MISKKIIVFLVSLIFFSRFNFTFADLVINEIMYNTPADQKSGDWFEVYNNGSDIIVQSDKTQHDNPWKFFKVGLSTKYYINSIDFTIKSGEYVIFSDNSGIFSDDYSTSSKVIDSTVSLSNSNKTTLQILDENGISITSAEYDPLKNLAAGDGNSLQLIGGEWKPALPTPGIINEAVTTPLPSVDDSNTSANSNSSSSSRGSSSSSEENSKVAEAQKIKTQITAKTLGFVGLPLSFLATTYGLNGEQLRYGKYFWNFGDGDSKEVNLTDSQSFIHTYFYSGDYVVSLDYFSNPYIYQNVPDASSKIIIKIVEADISISRVGEEKDFFIELTNNTDYNADISNWILASVVKNFIIPRNTILATKKKIIISPKITNFSIADRDTLKLMNSEKEVVFDYSLARQDPVKEVTATKTIVQPKISTAVKIPEAVSIIDEQIFPKDLSASALNSGVSEQGGKSPYSPIVIPLASLLFIGASAGAVYFIRQKKVIPQTGDDFEILDE